MTPIEFPEYCDYTRDVNDLHGWTKRALEQVQRELDQLRRRVEELERLRKEPNDEHTGNSG